MLEHLLAGFHQALQWQTFLAMLVGELVGILVGAAPGLTVTMAVSLMLPATFVLSPVAAMAMLLGVYTGGFMGNSIPAILIKIPGTPSAAATVFDGYALAQKGEAGKALGVSIIASLYGGLFSLICLVLIAPASKSRAPVRLGRGFLASALRDDDHLQLRPALACQGNHLGPLGSHARHGGA